MIKIPLQKVPSQTIKIKLNDQNCIIKVYFRFGVTYMDLTANGNVIVKGAACRYGTNILQYDDVNFKGSLHFFDMLGFSDPRYEEFGERFRLFYIPPNEDIPAALRW